MFHLYILCILTILFSEKICLSFHSAEVFHNLKKQKFSTESTEFSTKKAILECFYMPHAYKF